MKADESDTVKTILMTSAAPFLESPMALADRIILSLDSSNITAIAINREKDPFTLERKDNGLFSLTYPGQNLCPAHPPAVDYLVSQLSAMRADATLAHQTLKQEGMTLESMGLNPPQITIKINRM